MKTDFINNMTHEFKTPIATSSIAAEMILRPEISGKPEKARKYAKVILDENTRLQNQVEQVLQVASLENSRHRFKMKRVNIHSLIESAIESHELQIKMNNIKMKVELKAKRHYIIADRIHLLNVLNNLLDNAIKYTPDKPKITITTWNGNKGIYIRIKDNGIGIDPKYQANVFKNLYRVPKGDIHDVRGFGLGLYYAKSVVDSHNGNISLESEPGKGSSFEVFLPFDKTK